ncbi:MULTISPECIES: hypothetical protein [Rhizobium]|uniref:Uncharacterized protein n=1 Tax=Rhizobium miluonense TaxID=411945 RepID=A0A1C3UEE7_9HYPH|nr:hypothetical protein [Rhizobium miluonense]SCB13814.1 hypothetical protein GA0061102_100394 [Rhizobium miluonense]
MYGDSILPAAVAAVLGLISNVIALFAAFWAAGKFPRWHLAFHAIAVFIVSISPLIAMILGLPELFPDEEEPPGTRFAFLPLIVEAAIILLLYALAAMMFLSKSGQSSIVSWYRGDRYP